VPSFKRRFEQFADVNHEGFDDSVHGVQSGHPLSIYDISARRDVSPVRAQLRSDG
jgi:hypothetical protein